MPEKCTDNPRAKLRAQVAAVLIEDCGLPELVPVEFGGVSKIKPPCRAVNKSCVLARTIFATASLTCLSPRFRGSCIRRRPETQSEFRNIRKGRYCFARG